jgi:rare lipoprotein A
LFKITTRAPFLLPLCFLVACQSASETTGSIGSDRLSVSGRPYQSGMASWYQSGRRTASGEPFNPSGMTAAHRTLPFGTRVRVVDEGSGRSVVVRINDRGPFTRGRVIDLARGPAQVLGLTGSGTGYVSLHALD